ncbi:MAG: L28 family ribosomal protein [Bacilli bacterium]|nr:L28 family ribosomal protein [Bacilli bacterium]
MAKKETNKKPLFGNIRSHALNATRRKQNLNMQKVVNKDGETVLMTAREAKKFKKDQIEE